ncbi:hypothetical protein GCM10028796_01960 [Ramlibacter monticola]
MRSVRTVLAATDFSAGATHAARRAAMLAAEYDARLIDAAGLAKARASDQSPHAWMRKASSRKSISTRTLGVRCLRLAYTA